jgi:hypothetical protein
MVLEFPEEHVSMQVQHQTEVYTREKTDRGEKFQTCSVMLR